MAKSTQIGFTRYALTSYQRSVDPYGIVSIAVGITGPYEQLGSISAGLKIKDGADTVASALGTKSPTLTASGTIEAISFGSLGNGLGTLSVSFVDIIANAKADIRTFKLKEGEYIKNDVKTEVIYSTKNVQRPRNNAPEIINGVAIPGPSDTDVSTWNEEEKQKQARFFASYFTVLAEGVIERRPFKYRRWLGYRLTSFTQTQRGGVYANQAVYQDDWIVENAVVEISRDKFFVVG